MGFFARAGARLIENRIVFDGWNRFYDLIVDYTSSQGRTERISREVLDHGSAAAILLFDPARDIVVMVRQFRSGVWFAGKPPFLLEVPAGLIDDDDPLDAVRREALEETGYEVHDIEPLFPIFMSPGALTEEVHLFFGLVDATHRVAVGGGLDHEHEDIEIVELPVEQAFVMLKAGEINDAKTVILLQWLLVNRDRFRD